MVRGGRSSPFLVLPSDTQQLLPPAWGLAVLVSFCCSFLTVLGFVLQKQAQHSEGRRLCEISLTVRWIVGFLFSFTASYFGDLVAYGLAPVSLTAPMSGVAVALNSVVAPYWLSERVHAWPDFPATGLILAGTMLTTLTGARSDASDLSLEELTRLACEPAASMMLAGLATVLAPSVFYMARRAEEIEERAKQRPANPPIGDVMMPALAAACFGGLSNVLLKVVAELLKRGRLAAAAQVTTVFLAPVAAAQLNYLNKGLRLYVQTIFFPVYQSLLVILATSCGAFFFEEYWALLGSQRRCAIFVFGVLCNAIGIAFFAWRGTEGPVASGSSDKLRDLMIERDGIRGAAS